MNRFALRISFLLLFTASSVSAQQPDIALIQGFYQGNVDVDARMAQCLRDKVWGNCVTIGLVKTAAAQFGGFRETVRSWTNEGDNIQLVFHDGDSVWLHPADTSTVRLHTRLKEQAGGYPHMDSVTVILSGICRRIIKNRSSYFNAHCVNDIRDAMLYLNSGYPTANAGTLLGLRQIAVSSPDLRTSPALLLQCRAHAAFCSYGMQDVWGKPRPIDRKMYNAVRKTRITAYYIFAKS